MVKWILLVKIECYLVSLQLNLWPNLNYQLRLRNSQVVTIFDFPTREIFLDQVRSLLATREVVNIWTDVWVSVINAAWNAIFWNKLLIITPFQTNFLLLIPSKYQNFSGFWYLHGVWKGTEAVAWRSSVKKILKISQNSQKTPVPVFF